MYLTAKEFSRETGIAYRAVLDLLHAGKLPFILCGNRHKIPKESGIAALEALAAKNVTLFRMERAVRSAGTETDRKTRLTKDSIPPNPGAVNGGDDQHGRK